MDRKGVVCSVTTRGRVLIIENCLTAGVQAQELSEGRNVRYCPINERVISEVIQRRILIDTSAERAENALIHRKIPDFSCYPSCEVQTVFAGTGIAAMLAFRRLKRALL